MPVSHDHSVTGSLSLKIIEQLWKLNRIFCSSDYDASLEYLSTHLPFNIHTYMAPQPYKGWVIPPKWDLVTASIKLQGKVIFEVDHPLKIIGLSSSFQGKLSLSALKKHLHYDQRDANSIPYHFRQHYRPWEREWGFCVSKAFYDSLQEGEYEVEIITQESEGCLKVAEYIKHGKSPKGFAFVAHLDHPGMANDDLAGVAVGVELFHRLSQIETKFTYRLVLVQEIIGSVFYLEQTLGSQSDVLEACFLEMLGTETPFALQSSQCAQSQLEIMLEKMLLSTSNYRKGDFRSIICNDEIVWESCGIPMCSLSRYPYLEYHSDKDNLSIISFDALKSSVDILYDSVMKLDQSILMQKHFTGVLSLAHPTYNLYIDPGQPAFGTFLHDPTNQQKLRLLMDTMALLPKNSFVDSLANQLQIPLDRVLNYLQQWEAKALVSLT